MVITQSGSNSVIIRLPLAKRNYGKQRRFYECAKEWNILAAPSKGINSLLFKQNIKSYITIVLNVFIIMPPLITLLFNTRYSK